MLFTDVEPHAKTLLSKNCRQDLALTLTQYILEATQNKLGLVKLTGKKSVRNNPEIVFLFFQIKAVKELNHYTCFCSIVGC